MTTLTLAYPHLKLNCAVRPDALVATPAAAAQHLPALISAGDSRAASLLYQRYDESIRFYLRRAHMTADMDEAVYRILLNTLRELRHADNIDQTDIEDAVLKSIGAERRARASKSLRHRTLGASLEIMSSLFTSLTATEREVLLRAFVLLQPVGVIAAQMQLTNDFVVNVRTAIRRRYHNLAACTNGVAIN